jgi:hypothetical protein
MSHSLANDARSTTARLLGVSGTAPVDEVRSAFLKRLTDSEFVAAPADIEAAAVLGASARLAGPHPALDRETEQFLAGNIEKLSEDYWNLDPAARRERWEALMGACEQFPRLSGRLMQLKGGLDLVPPTQFAEPREAALAAAIVELYPLKAATRAARRQHLLNEIGPRADVEAAARSLCESSDKLGPIDHGLLDTLANKHAAVPVIRTRYIRPASQETASAPETSNNNWWWLVLPILFCGGGVLRNIPSQSGSSSSDRYSSSQYVSSPSIPKLTFDPNNPPGEGLQRLMGVKTIIHHLRPLNPVQKELFRQLAKRESLAEDEATTLANVFVDRRGTGDRNPTPDAGADKQWSDFLAKELTDDQRKIVERLSTGYMTTIEIRKQLIAFVEAGKRTSVTPANAQKRP